MNRSTAFRGMVSALVLAGAAIAIATLRRDLTEPVDTSGAGLRLPTERRGRGAIADARVVASRREPMWARDLAGWVPDPIGSRPLQLLAYVWALPSTVVGLLLGLVSLGSPSVRDGVIVFRPVRGLVALAMRRGGFTATTLGHVVLAREEPSDALMAHELVHTRQAERLGPLMGPVYWLLLARYGYARHPMERAARIAGRAARHAGAGQVRPRRRG